MCVRSALALGLSALWLVSGCSSGQPGPPPPEGISNIRSRVKARSRLDDPDRFYLELYYDVYFADGLPEDTFIGVKTACQVGDVRLVDSSRFSPARPGPGRELLRPGKKLSMEDHPFITNPLPGKPTLCDVQLTRIDNILERTGPTLARACLRKNQVTEGPCPAHEARRPAGQTGPVSVHQVSVSIDPASDLFPEALLVRYVFTAHEDMQPEARVRMAVTCRRRTDEVWHSMVGQLAAGESSHHGQLKHQGRVPSPDTPCDITYHLAFDVRRLDRELARFCYRDGQVSAGACAARR